jgi:hypothetical protein
LALLRPALLLRLVPLPVRRLVVRAVTQLQLPELAMVQLLQAVALLLPALQLAAQAVTRLLRQESVELLAVLQLLLPKPVARTAEQPPLEVVALRPAGCRQMAVRQRACP